MASDSPARVTSRLVRPSVTWSSARKKWIEKNFPATMEIEHSKIIYSLDPSSSCSKTSDLEHGHKMMDVPLNQLLLEDEQKMENIKSPHHNDVLSGRGVKTNRHPGNESFRSLVSLNKVRRPRHRDHETKLPF